MQIIINEYKYIQEMIKERKKKDDVSIYKLIRYMIMYYYPDFENKSAKSFQQFILNELSLFNFSLREYQEYQYAGYVLRMCRKYLKGELNHELRNFDSVSVTKAEIEKINKCEDEKERKVLFTIYALAKVSVNPTGWVNYSIQDIFKRANVTMKALERFALIHRLYKHNFIKLNNIINKHGYYVKLEPESEVDIIITDFMHIGNTYLHKYKDDWVMCQYCGRMIKYHGNGRPPKYCKKCKDIAARELDIEYQKKRRKKSFAETLMNTGLEGSF